MKLKNKLTYVIIGSLLLNIILAYGMFWQWRSRTVQFMDNYRRFQADVMLTIGHLDRYLEGGDDRDLEAAFYQQLKVFERHNIFNTYYYYNTLGSQMAGHISSTFSPSLLSLSDAPDPAFLKQYKADLETILDALTVDEENWIWVTTPIPRHPIDRNFVQDILTVFEEDISTYPTP